MRKMSRFVTDRGFTLVELLVVIVILGILSAVAIFAVGGVNSQGRKSACLADLSSVQTAAEAYFAKNGSYPAGNDSAGIAVLVSAKFLRSAPATGNGYTVTYTASTGVVGSTPACSTLT